LRLLFSRDFIPFAGANAILQGGFFAYIAGVSFVFINDYGLSSMAFSILFGINAFGLISGTQVSSRLVGRISPVKILRIATGVYMLCGVVLLVLKVSGVAHLWAVAALLFVFVASLGGIMPSCNMLAMERNGAFAGTAAALLGALGFGLGAVVSAVLGAFSDGSTLALFTIITICGATGFTIANVYFPKFAVAEKAES
jgi:DHA1 family bicyclomycin/chloramphenicol resistance-like MFS transporter